MLAYLDNGYPYNRMDEKVYLLAMCVYMYYLTVDASG